MKVVKNDRTQVCLGATKHAFENLLQSISEQVCAIEVQLTVNTSETHARIKKGEHAI